MRWKISGIQRGKLQELEEILPTSLTTPKTGQAVPHPELWEPRDTLSRCYMAGTEGAGGQADTVTSASSPHSWLVVLGAGHCTVLWWPLCGHPSSRSGPADYIHPESSSCDLGRCWSPEMG